MEHSQTDEIANTTNTPTSSSKSAIAASGVTCVTESGIDSPDACNSVFMAKGVPAAAADHSLLEEGGVATSSITAVQAEANELDNIDRYGVTVGYLNEFVELCGGRAALESTKTFEIYDIFVKPMTKDIEKSLCYKLKLDGKHDKIGIAMTFVSHVWNYKFIDVVDALNFHFRDHPNEVVCIDLFSRNQHRSTSTIQNYFEYYENLMKTMKTSVVVLDHNLWKPTIIKRAWCLVEIHWCLCNNIPIDFAVSRKNLHYMFLEAKSDPFRFFDMLFFCDSRSSTSTNPYDQFKIFSKIDSSTVPFIDINGYFLGRMLHLLHVSRSLNENSPLSDIDNASDSDIDNNSAIDSDRDDAAVPLNEIPSQVANSKSVQISSLGVKVSFLRRFIEENGGTAAFAGLKTEDVCKTIIIEATKDKRSSMLDVLLEQKSPDVGEAEWFISHAWKYNFLDSVMYIENFFRQEFPDTWADVTIWFDLFCNSQHDTKKEFDWWAHQFSSHLRRIGRILILTCPVGPDVQEPGDGIASYFQPYCFRCIWCVFVGPDVQEPGDDIASYFQPYCFRRIWCVFEFFSSTKVGCLVEVAISEEDQNFLLRLANEKGAKGLLSYIRQLLDLRTAEAFLETDLIQIQDLIKNDIGYDAVERDVFNSLVTVLMRKIGLYSDVSKLDKCHREILQELTDLCFEAFIQ